MSQVISLILLVIIGLATLAGVKRGLRKELLNLAGVVAAFLGGVFLAKPVGLLFARFGIIEEVPYLLAFAGGFLLASLGFSVVKGRLKPKEVDLAERMSGGLVGFGKGLVGAALIIYLLVGIWPASAGTMARAPVARFVMPLTRVVDAAVGAARVLLPADLTDRIRDGFESLRDAAAGIDDAFETLEEAGEKARAYQEKIGEGAAVVDSLAGKVIPPDPDTR